MNEKLAAPQSAALRATVPAWRHDAERDAITREFVLHDFAQAFAFMTQIALEAERRQHHPEWSNVYNRVAITWTTHDAGGLTHRDIQMARFCDEAFAGLGS